MNPLEKVHERSVAGRRVRVLAELLAPQIPAGARVLEVGSGDGRLTRLVADLRPDLAITAIDVLVRPGARFPVQPFDGRNIPYGDRDFDVVMLVDVLHHADDPGDLLAEATRVARKHVLVKDHVLEGFLAGPTLAFMDWVGNARHGVASPHRYWTLARWRAAFAKLDLSVTTWLARLELYAWPWTLVFDRRLHYVALLTREDRPAGERASSRAHG